MMRRKQTIILSCLVLSFLLAGGAMAKSKNFEFKFPEGIEDCNPNTPSPVWIQPTPVVKHQVA